MKMNFEELDDTTRRYMLEEFDAEQASDNPYRSKSLSSQGLSSFPDLMREAILEGDEQTLAQSLARPEYWNPTEGYRAKDGTLSERRVNPDQAATRLATNEFNTAYVHGLAKRLLDEGCAQCQVYRAATPKWEPGECSSHDGQILSVEEVYRGHRAQYWPEPGNPDALSVPFQPGCHHTIRRVR